MWQLFLWSGGRGWLGAVAVVMALSSVSCVPLTSCGRMRREEAEVTAKTGPLLRDGSSSDRTGRIDWGWGGVLIKTRLDGPGGGREGGHEIVPSEGKGHQSVSDSLEESRRRPLTSGISPPLTSHHDTPPPKTRGVAYVSPRV